MINTYNNGTDQEKILYFLNRIYNTINSKNVNLNALDNIVNELIKYKSGKKNEYLMSLLYPELSKGCKIPATLPIPTCSFQIHNTLNLTTNEQGALVLIFNPFFLYSDTLINQDMVEGGTTPYTLNYASSLYMCNDNRLDGRTVDENINWKLMNIGQGIPNIYNQYRLVSASLIVKYIGRMDITSGVIGGAIIFDDAIKPGTSLEHENVKYDIGNRNVLKKYCNIDLAIDSYYHQETNCVNGLREVYFPVDNSYEEYAQMKYNKSQLTASEITPINLIPEAPINYMSHDFSDFDNSKFQQIVYMIGAPPSSQCFKMDIYLNFEALPNASFLNYMPISPNKSVLSNEQKKETIHLTQQNAITTANASSVMNIPNEDNKLFSKLGSFIDAGTINNIDSI